MQSYLPISIHNIVFLASVYLYDRAVLMLSPSNELVIVFVPIFITHVSYCIHNTPVVMYIFCNLHLPVTIATSDNLSF
jgi:hypothetical protein